MAKKSRVFLRGMSSEQYGLKEFREAQLAAPRVRNDDFVADDAQVGHSGDSKDSRTWWRIGPGDEPFLTQNLQVHFVEIPPGKANHGHGHQNESVFYILQGKGYEIHDDVKYPWEAGDLAIVHVDFAFITSAFAVSLPSLKWRWTESVCTTTRSPCSQSYRSSSWIS